MWLVIYFFFLLVVFKLDDIKLWSKRDFRASSCFEILLTNFQYGNT